MARGVYSAEDSLQLDNVARFLAQSETMSMSVTVAAARESNTSQNALLFGHPTSGHQVQAPSQSGSTSAAPKWVCYGCNQPGHKVWQCPNRTDGHGGHGGQGSHRGQGGQGGQGRRNRNRNRGGRNQWQQNQQANYVVGQGLLSQQAHEFPRHQQQQYDQFPPPITYHPPQHFGQQYPPAQSANVAQSSTPAYMLVMNCTPMSVPVMEGFFLDSGATSHMVRSLKMLHNVFEVSIPIHMADGNKVTATHMGSLLLRCFRNSSATPALVTLTNVLFVPYMRTNLLSVASLADKRCTVKFGSDKFVVHNHNDEEVLTGTREGNLFRVACTHVSGHAIDKIPEQAHLTYVDPVQSVSLWHYRLGHVGIQKVHNTLSAGGIPVKNSSLGVCGSCAMGGQHRDSFPSRKKNVQKTVVYIFSCRKFL